MGRIIPNNVQTGQPGAIAVPLPGTNRELNLGEFLGTVGDALNGLSGPPGTWEQILKRRDQEAAATQDRMIKRQRYQNELREQQFKNNLAAQTLRVKMMQAMGKNQSGDIANFYGTANPNPMIQGLESFMPPTTKGVAPVGSPTVLPTSKVSMNDHNEPLSSSMPANTVAALSTLGPSAAEAAPKTPSGINAVSPAARTNNGMVDNSPAVNLAPKHQYITPDILPDAIKSRFNNLRLHMPDVANDILRMANYEVTPQEVASKYKDRSRTFQEMMPILRDVNPTYDPAVADANAQIKKDLANPKTRLGRLEDLNTLAVQTARGYEAAQNLPDTGIPFLNRLYQPLSRLFSNKLSTFEQTTNPLPTQFERVINQGRPTVASIAGYRPLLSPHLGRQATSTALKLMGKEEMRTLLDEAVQAYNRTKGYGGLPASAIDSSLLDQFKKAGWITVENDKIIPKIDVATFDKIAQGL